MKFIIFNKKTAAPSSGGCVPAQRISVNTKNGVFRIGSGCPTGLLDAGKLSLMQDFDNPDRWYIHEDADGFESRRDKAGQSKIFNCKQAAQSIADSLPPKEPYQSATLFKFTVAPEPVALKLDHERTVTAYKIDLGTVVVGKIRK